MAVWLLFMQFISGIVLLFYASSASKPTPRKPVLSFRLSSACRHSVIAACDAYVTLLVCKTCKSNSLPELMHVCWATVNKVVRGLWFSCLTVSISIWTRLIMEVLPPVWLADMFGHLIGWLCLLYYNTFSLLMELFRKLVTNSQNFIYIFDTVCWRILSARWHITSGCLKRLIKPLLEILTDFRYSLTHEHRKTQP